MDASVVVWGFAGLALAVVAWGAFEGIQAARLRLSLWWVGRRLGLRRTRDALLEGAWAGAQVTVRGVAGPWRSGRPRRQWLVVTVALPGLSWALVHRRDDWRPWMARPFAGLGDGSDAPRRVEVDATLDRADFALERALRRVTAEVEAGEVSGHFMRVPRSPRRLRACLEAVVDAARLLAEGPPLPARLVRAARDDQDALRAARALECLAALHLDSEEARTACEAAARDPRARVRAVAGRFLPLERAVPVLTAVFEDPGATREERSFALHVLAQRAAPEVVRPWVLKALSDRWPMVQLTGWAFAGRLKLVEARPVMAANLHHGQREVQLATLRAIGQMGDPALEDLLVGGLTLGWEAAVIAALEGLGEIGTREALPAVQRLATGRASAAVRGAAAAAAQRILQRHPGVAGGLALADVEGGGLAVVAPEGGLSEPEP